MKKITLLLTLLSLIFLAACAATPAPTPVEPTAAPTEAPSPTPAPPPAPPAPLPPLVVSFSPAVGEEQPPDAPVEITFDQPMERASVEKAFAIEPGPVWTVHSSG
jgi:hypothetical protein